MTNNRRILLCTQMTQIIQDFRRFVFQIHICVNLKKICVICVLKTIGGFMLSSNDTNKTNTKNICEHSFHSMTK